MLEFFKSLNDVFDFELASGIRVENELSADHRRCMLFFDVLDLGFNLLDAVFSGRFVYSLKLKDEHLVVEHFRGEANVLRRLQLVSGQHPNLDAGVSKIVNSRCDPVLKFVLQCSGA